ncbi:MAG: hypothetical protein AAF600_04590 [Bacteroidota bacterium]
MNEEYTLVEFLYRPNNSKVKESIFNYKLFYDLKIASAKSGRILQVFVPEVDMDGTDVVFQLESYSRSIQLKTSKNAPAKSWKIHPHLILPKYDRIGSVLSATLFGEPATDTTGLGGGFILINPVFEENDVSKVNYFYTDIGLIYLFSKGIISKKRFRACQKHAKETLSNAYKNSRNDKMKIYMSNMIPLRSKESLLEITLLKSLTSIIVNNLDNETTLVEELKEELLPHSDQIQIIVN